MKRQGHARDFSLAANSEGPKAHSGGGGSWGGAASQQPLPHQLGGLRERCELRQRVRCEAPTAQGLFTIFSTQDGLS